MAPMVIDDFGDVYGFYLMLTGRDYTWRDLYDVADDIKRQLVLVDGVRKVSIDGEQQEVVYLDISRARLAELGIDPRSIADILGSQNSVVDAGNTRVGDDYLRIRPTGEFQSVQEIGEVLIGSSERRLVRLRDIARSPAPTRKCRPSSITTTACRPCPSA
jgi:multidrug efflux pump subunit AcrB